MQGGDRETKNKQNKQINNKQTLFELFGKVSVAYAGKCTSKSTSFWFLEKAWKRSKGMALVSVWMVRKKINMLIIYSKKT